MLDFGPSGAETVLGEGTTKPGDGLALLQGNTVDWAGTSTLILDRNIDRDRIPENATWSESLITPKVAPRYRVLSVPGRQC